jgi:predicted permease
MFSLRNVRTGLRALFRRDLAEREIQDEVRDYLERETESHQAAGLSAQAAARAARASMGSVTAVEEAVRSAGWEGSVAIFWRDLRYGARMLRRTPGFSAIAILTLALGIGANTALFSVADGVLFKPLPVVDPDRLVFFAWNSAPKGMPPISVAGVMQDPATGQARSTAFAKRTFDRFRSETTTLSGVFAFGAAAGTPQPGEPTPPAGQLVSGNYFLVLGTTARLGRLLTTDDDRDNAPLVVVISHRYWRRAFGGDPDVIGRTMRFESQMATIVGVTPAGFSGTGQLGDAPDFFLPMAPGAAVSRNKFAVRMKETWIWPLRIFGRLKPGATPEDVQRDLSGVFQSTAAEAWRSKKSTGAPPSELPRLEVAAGSQGLTESRNSLTRMVTTLAAGVGLVLLIVCVNLTNLLLARAEARQKEMAVRLAIGARRGRLVRQLLTESLLMTFSGAAFGALVAYWGKDVLLLWIARVNPAFVIEPQVDLRAFGFTAAVAIAAGLFVGLAPALRATRVDPHPTAREAAPTGRRGLVGRAILVVQIGLAVILLVAAGLFVRTFRNLQAADVGFNTSNLLLFRSSWATTPPRDLDGAQIVGRMDDLVERLQALPGVRSVAYSQNALLTGELAMPYLSVPGRPREPGEDRTVYTQGVSPTFFRTLEMPIVRGRTLEPQDRERNVAIINQALAARFFPGVDPVGKRIGITKDPTAPDLPDGSLLDIVGVIRDARYETVRQPPPPSVFVLIAQPGPASYAVRTDVEPLSIAAAVRAAGRDITPFLTLSGFTTEAEQAALTFARERHFALLSSVFGALALALTSIGLYGLLSYGVARRTQEIGIRMALGARGWHVVRAIVRETLALVVVGVVLGLAAARALTSLVESLLFGLGSNDPATLAGTVSIMLTVAVLAAAVPARRAATVDPLAALRHE